MEARLQITHSHTPIQLLLLGRPLLELCCGRNFGFRPPCKDCLPALCAQLFFAQFGRASPAALGRSQLRKCLRVDILFSCHAVTLLARARMSKNYLRNTKYTKESLEPY